MGLCNRPDIFQEKMNKLFLDLDHVQHMVKYTTTSSGQHWINLQNVHCVFIAVHTVPNAELLSETKTKMTGHKITKQAI